MGHQGAAWLGQRTRVVEETPDQVVDGMGLAPDAQVAEVGAGTGYFTFRIAEAVPTGRLRGRRATGLPACLIERSCFAVNPPGRRCGRQTAIPLLRATHVRQPSLIAKTLPSPSGVAWSASASVGGCLFRRNANPMQSARPIGPSTAVSAVSERRHRADADRLTGLAPVSRSGGEQQDRTPDIPFRPILPASVRHGRCRPCHREPPNERQEEP
jgi:hypothetical protein